MEEIKGTFNKKTEDRIERILQDSACTKNGLAGHELNISSFIRIALQRSSDLIFIVDADASFIFINQATCKLLGLVERGLNSLKLYDIDMLCDATIWQKKFKTLRTASSLNWETYYYTQDGDIFPISVTLNYMVNEGREYGLGIARDITAYKKMETALHECKLNYQKVMESSDLSLVRVDMLGMITGVDRAIRELTGHTDGELIGKHVTSIIYDEDIPEIMQMIDQAVSGKKPAGQVECRLKNSNNGIVWCSAVLADLKPYGKNTGCTVILRDIARQKILEETVKKSQQRYVTAIDAPRELIYRFIPDGTITYVNSDFCWFSEKQSIELIGCNFLSIINERNHAAFISSINALLDKPSVMVFGAFADLTDDGQQRQLEYTMKALLDERGQIIQFQVVLTDSTERNRAVQMLKDSHQQYQLILNHMLGGVAVFEIIYDGDRAIDSRFVEINVAFEKFIGMPASEIIGKTVWEIFPATSILQANLWWESVVKQENICLDEIYFPNIDRCFRLTGFSPKKGRYVVMVMDVAGNKKETESTITTDRIYSLGEMAAGLVHEANNPLISVVRLSQLLLAQPDLPPKIKEDLLNIEIEASRAAGILKEFLVFAKRQKLKKQMVDINEFIIGVVRLHQNHLDKSQIDVRYNLSMDLPRIMIDIAQIQQVLTNIILNAEYFMSAAHNKGILHITSEKLDDRVKIICDDDGPGIAAKDMPCIFKPFFSNKENGRGIGLGLSVSYKIIKEHKGKIYAEAREEGGARFIIELPLLKT